MLSVRPALRQWTRRVVGAGVVRSSSSSLTPLEKGRQELEEEKSATQRKVEAMTKVDPWMVYGTVEADAPPELPENPAELSALDPAHHVDSVMPDGSKRLVHIRQDQWKPGQNPIMMENKWIISFLDEGTTATQNWNNPLMGWVSGSDPMASNIQLQMEFNTASEAVYFAKKRGWQFLVEKPILRPGRSDDTQYQDNFLPQRVAAMVKRDKTLCNYWERSQAGTSHYQRPLTYHGDGIVEQYGPNGGQKIAPHVPGVYKMR